MDNHIYQQEYRKALTIKANEEIDRYKRILQTLTSYDKYSTASVAQINYQLTKYENFIETINELSYIGIVEDMEKENERTRNVWEIRL